jgi:hypothetical protein
MRKISFEEDEYIVMAMFEGDTREETIGKIEEALSFVKNDTELVEVLTSTVEKMKRMPEGQFASLNLKDYLVEDEED